MLNRPIVIRPTHRQSGASLIEVLVAILILSFGMLSLGAMLAYSVQMPKLSGHRTTAINIASDHIERIRANPTEFLNGTYSSALSFDGTFDPIALVNCTFPNCTTASLAAMDIAYTKHSAREELPGGGLLVKCDGGACGANSFGNVWIVWREPDMSAAIVASSSDQCPVDVTGTYPATSTTPAPRCIYVRFKI